jgi:hypothetical protein
MLPYQLSQAVTDAIIIKFQMTMIRQMLYSRDHGS